MKILVIEDEADLREDIMDILTYEGFTCLGAENGQRGVEVAQAELPDLIICDVMMPVLDGFGALGQLRQEVQTANIPFIFLTARSSRSDLRQGMDLGADDYLTKPFTQTELMTAIRTRLDKRASLEKSHQQQLEHLQSQLVRALPHQIRTPLNGILGYASLLNDELDKLDPAEIREMAQNIQTACHNLHGMIENYLLFAQTELILNKPDHLARLRQERLAHWDLVLVDILEHKAEQFAQGQRVQFAKPEPGLNLAIGLDGFSKLMSELLDNAYRFSDPGALIQLEHQLQAPFLCLQLQNPGPGPNPAQLAALAQNRHFLDHLRDSIGMGLLLCKRLAEIYQGRLEVDSQADHTLVKLYLRLAP